jgi:hypothetical protein
MEKMSLTDDIRHSLDTKLANSNDILGRPVRAAEDPVLLLEWFKQCRPSHLLCKTGTFQMFRPTRLIDVGSNASPQLRLRNGTQCSGPYATLSYCWGKSQHNLTTKSTLQASMTGLDISELCKTMHDAIIVTRNLQLSYLWIDALCIVQDDPDDWEREALSMSEVYTQSTITLAATSSSNSDGGLFFPRPTGLPAQLLWTFSDGSPPERVNFRSYNHRSYDTLVGKGPLNKRSWAFQERYLSRRVVHFTTDRLYWECDQITIEEGFGSPFPTHRLIMRFVRSAIRLNEEMIAFDENWREMVLLYTTTHLTCKTDRLPAIAGLAKLWAKTSTDRYIAGCWQKNLIFHLLWTAKVRCEHTAMPPHPSWSWVSFDGPVCFYGPDSPSQFVSLVDDLVVKINGSSTAALYVGVREGVLELIGRIKPTIFTDGRTDDKYDQRMPWSMALDEREYVFKGASFDRTPKLGDMVWMLRLSRCENVSKAEWTEYVLLLEEVHGGEGFERVGLGKISWSKRLNGEKGERIEEALRDSWFDDVPDVRVKVY